jgi:hypothetical protein
LLLPAPRSFRSFLLTSPEKSLWRDLKISALPRILRFGFLEVELHP